MPTRKRPRLPSDIEARTIHEQLGAELSSVLGDRKRELLAFGRALDALMAVKHADGLPAHAAPGDVLVPEFVWDGDTYNPPIYERIEGFDRKRDWDRLTDALNDVVHAYEQRVGA